MDDAQALQEVQRLANQRSQDLAAAQAREQEREYQRGRREAEVNAKLNEHELHLSRINGSIDSYTRALESLEAQMSKLEKAYTTSTAVAAAIADKAVSTRTFIYGVLTLLVPIIVLVVTLIATKP